MGNQSDLQKNTNQTLGEISDPNTSGSILEVGTEILHPLEDAGRYCLRGGPHTDEDETLRAQKVHQQDVYRKERSFFMRILHGRTFLTHFLRNFMRTFFLRS